MFLSFFENTKSGWNGWLNEMKKGWVSFWSGIDYNAELKKQEELNARQLELAKKLRAEEEKLAAEKKAQHDKEVAEEKAKADAIAKEKMLQLQAEQQFHNEWLEIQKIAEKQKADLEKERANAEKKAADEKAKAETKALKDYEDYQKKLAAFDLKLANAKSKEEYDRILKQRIEYDVMWGIEHGYRSVEDLYNGTIQNDIDSFYGTGGYQTPTGKPVDTPKKPPKNPPKLPPSKSNELIQTAVKYLKDIETNTRPLRKIKYGTFVSG
jgi:hypothetical protein